ncbi:sulfite exporter TauE/SafE family protein [Rhodohalobacter sp. 8-1]|uniref:sulfite exporter TauE/SafE family protein n=1 Tax=Rhodohalobacter sp. 8-1 TaxID=3131972 RepID=UPI0030EE7851
MKNEAPGIDISVRNTKNPSLLLYWITALVIVSAWAIAMQILQWWPMFAETWPISLTMVLGSFIAGATSEGGGAVAFPVFTKLFDIEPADAKVFSFFIQSMGMTMAGLFIYLKKIPVLWNVIGTALCAGIGGLIIGELFLVIPNPYPKLLFTFIAGIFAFFLIYNRWGIPNNPEMSFRFNHSKDFIIILTTGFLGGLVASVVGVGIDMLIFIVLTLLYGIDEKISTPTTVVLMGLLSVAGFIWHAGITTDVNPDVWRYWMSCVPIVIFGAPLGAWVCSKIGRDQLIWFLLFLIAIEVASTLWIIPITPDRIAILAVLVVCTSLLFYGLVRYRRINDGF